MIYLPRGKQSFLKLRGDLALASLLFADEGSRRVLFCSPCFLAKEAELNQRLLTT